MCRHLCYLGEPIGIGELVFDAPHSLAVQSYAPKDMRGGGRVNADGFGLGWLDQQGGLVRYRRAGPIWQDAGLRSMASAVSSTAMLAAVRNATVGMPVTESAAAPFTDGRWLFSLNGRIDGWPDAAVGLASELPVRELLTLDAPTDAALLWSVLRHRLAAAEPDDSGRSGPSLDPSRLLAELIDQVLAVAPASRLNLLLTDGRRCYASTLTHSLWYRRSSRGTVLASEPLDDQPDWQPIDDGRLVVADRDGVTVTELPGRAIASPAPQ
ncbi:MAG: ergothioneine biosynthesis protein EgtC [Jatrophihabitantaceae bacterium]